MIGLAAVFGLLAVFVAQIWLNSQADKRAHSLQTDNRPVATHTIVVAKQPLRFGMVLKASMLREVPWPATAVPAGTFAKIKDILSRGRRVVLKAMEPNEPVLAAKITGPGERATLSALVHKGMKAVTIRVNDVQGVGGFVQPGDHVDVVLTRQLGRSNATTEVVLQDVRVLAVGQNADGSKVKPTVPKSVTLEVNTVDAQKLWLAASVGNLSLLLRPAGETTDARTQKITLRDLADNTLAPKTGATTTVVVIRPKSQQSYTVPVEATDGASAATVGQRVGW